MNWFRRHREQSGAIAVMMALIICFVLIPLSAFAVDIGMQRIARKDAQAVADTTALDMARALGSNGTVSDAAATTSANLNSGVVGNGMTVHVYKGTLTSDFVADQSLGCDGEPYNDYFTETAAPATPNAVLVTVTNSVKFQIMGGSGGVCRSAIGTSASSACFDLGSYAAAINTGDSSLLAPLNSLLGAKLSLLSYQGLANANVTLAGLAADSHIGGVSQLLTTGVSFGSLVQATLDVLDKSDPNYSANVSAIGAILNANGSVGSVALGNQLSISPDDTAALDTEMSVLDILTGAILVADGSHAIDVPTLWAQVAGVGTIAKASLAMIQGKQHACAPHTATASQLTGTIDFGKLNSPSVNIPGLATLQTSPATGTLTVNLGNATGNVVTPPAVYCGAGTTADPDTFTVGVTSSLASVDFNSKVAVSGTVNLLGIGLVALNIVVDLDINNTATAGTRNANLKIPPNDTTPVSTGSGLALSTANLTATVDPASTATVLGLPISLSLISSTTNAIIQGLVGPTAPLMTKTLVPLVSNINTLLTGPLAKLLGLDLAGADVYGYRPSCSSPELDG